MTNHIASNFSAPISPSDASSTSSIGHMSFDSELGVDPTSLSAVSPKEQAAIGRKLGTIEKLLQRLEGLKQHLSTLMTFSVSDFLKTSKTVTQISTAATDSTKDMSTVSSPARGVEDQVKTQLSNVQSLVTSKIKTATQVPEGFVEALKTGDTKRLLDLAAQYKKTLSFVLDKGTNRQTKPILRDGFAAFEAAVRGGKPQAAIHHLIQAFERYQVGQKKAFYTQIVSDLKAIEQDCRWPLLTNPLISHNSSQPIHPAASAAKQMLSQDPSTLDRPAAMAMLRDLADLGAQWYSTINLQTRDSDLPAPLILDHHQLQSLRTLIASVERADIVKEGSANDPNYQMSEFFSKYR